VFSQLLGSSRAIYSFHSAQSGLRSKITDRKVKHKVDLTQAMPTNTYTAPSQGLDECGVSCIL